MIVIVRFTEVTFEIQLDALVNVTALRRCALSLCRCESTSSNKEIWERWDSMAASIGSLVESGGSVFKGRLLHKETKRLAWSCDPPVASHKGENEIKTLSARHAL
jgi:hypothetical protein